MKPLLKLASAATVAALTSGLAACGDDGGHGAAHEEQTARNGDVFNDADVEFATAMIPHHAQALSMVDLTLERDLSPELEKLTEEIQTAQSPEIEQMTGWLSDWGKPIPETMRDHVNAGHDGEHGSAPAEHSDMPGMMSDEQMADLEAARGAEFEEMWLELMIEHHRGAVEMAEDEKKDGTFGPAVDLAKSIVTSQQGEIDRMEAMLDS